MIYYEGLCSRKHSTTGGAHNSSPMQQECRPLPHSVSTHFLNHVDQYQSCSTCILQQFRHFSRQNNNNQTHSYWQLISHRVLTSYPEGMFTRILTTPTMRIQTASIQKYSFFLEAKNQKVKTSKSIQLISGVHK